MVRVYQDHTDDDDLATAIKQLLSTKGLAFSSHNVHVRAGISVNETLIAQSQNMHALIKYVRCRCR